MYNLAVDTATMGYLVVVGYPYAERVRVVNCDGEVSILHQADIEIVGLNDINIIICPKCNRMIRVNQLGLPDAN